MTYLLYIKNFLIVILFALFQIACSGGETKLTTYSCTVAKVDGGALISCPDGSQEVILDGSEGTDGTNGVDGEDAILPDSNVVEIIDPCGPSGGFDEVLLVLADGSIVAYFSGVGGFLTVLTCDQNYITTDNQACPFLLDNECNYVEN